MSQITTVERQIYLDYLRIIATLAVIIIHVSASNWHDLPVDSSGWMAHNFWNGISRFSVPVFVMISGTLFLNRRISLRVIIKRYVLRIGIVYLIWSAAYATFYYFFKGANLNGVISTLVFGPDHLWFLFMIVGLYLIVPFLKSIIEKGYENYFIFLAFVFSFMFPEILEIVKLFSEKAFFLLDDTIRHLNLFFPLGYSGYFLLGYKLGKKDLSLGFEILMYVLGLLCFLFTIFGTWGISLFLQEKQELFYEYLTVNVLFEAVAVYVFCKKRLACILKKKRFITLVSKSCFGIYLVHIMVLSVFETLFDIGTTSINPWVSIPIISVCIFFISLIISWVLGKIPRINRYLV